MNKRYLALCLVLLWTAPLSAEELIDQQDAQTNASVAVLRMKIVGERITLDSDAMSEESGDDPLFETVKGFHHHRRKPSLHDWSAFPGHPGWGTREWAWSTGGFFDSSRYVWSGWTAWTGRPGAACQRHFQSKLAACQRAAARPTGACLAACRKMPPDSQESCAAKCQASQENATGSCQTDMNRQSNACSPGVAI